MPEARRSRIECRGKLEDGRFYGGVLGNSAGPKLRRDHYSGDRQIGLSAAEAARAGIKAS